MKSKLISLIFLLISLQSFSQAQLNPPEIILNPDNYYKYSSDSRRFTGIPGIAVTPDGRFWATWYAGITPGEDLNNYIVLATNNGKDNIWEEVLVIDPDGKGPVRAYDPVLWTDPNGKLWLFWNQNVGYDGKTSSVWYTTIENTEQTPVKWSDPQRIADGVMMSKPTVLSDDNGWLFPISTWRETDNSAKVYLTRDNGKTWTLQGSAHVPKGKRSFDEHMIVELENDTLWMLVRTNYGIGVSFSADKGITWSEVQPSSIEHVSSRFFIRRLQSGNLLLVKHGPIDVKTTSRSHLMAFISKDDGKTWSKGLLIDERSGISYPDGQQTDDGKIYLIYDFDRRGMKEINYTYFTEEDILSPNYDERTIDVFMRRKNVSKGRN